MKLNDELKAFKAEFLGKVDKEVISILESAAKDLEEEFAERKSLGVGDLAPNFTLPDAKGHSVTLSERLKDGPAIITFYRGGWCPYCNLELRAYQQILTDIRDAGGSLIAVSPQTPDSSLSTAEKNDLEFDVLSDVGSNVSQDYGVAYKLPQELIDLYNQLGGRLPDFNGTEDWTLPIPATFVIDEDFRVVLAHIDTDYQNRLEPSEALTALKQLRVSAVSS
ncbi:MAG: peroxiredoxin-like family protein [Verrucomicrobiota bacterium]